MPPEVNLFLNNASLVISIITLIGLSLFIFLSNRKKEANIALSLSALCVAIFYTSHLFGINVSDSELSRKILMFNVSTIFILTFNLQALLAFFNQAKQKRWLIIFVHLSAVIVSIVFFIFPNLFLLPSEPKMYFPNYYVPGPLNTVRLILPFLIILPYIFYILFKQYQTSKLLTEKKQIKYFTFAILAGYAVGLIPNFLVYNIKVDPLWGVPAGIIFGIPFVYGALKYQLFNIRVIAKQAFVYGVGVATIGTIIAFLNYSSRLVLIIYPNFPIWSIYIVSSIIIVTTSVIIWHRLRENDLLKAQFITTVAHKFRTPLTVVKWALENLNNSELDEKQKTQVSYIQRENSKLVELTNLLIKISRNEKDSYEYRIQKNNFSAMADRVIEMLEGEALEKGVAIDKEYNPDIFANFDESRTNFVLQVLIENAIHYSKKGNVITVSVEKGINQIICKVKDRGIGITKDDLTRIFNRFYRGRNASLADTEGMGIGLSISKDIVENQGGTISGESDGPDRGSIFTFTLPSTK